MNNFSLGDSHVAQQSRRNKLRVQNSENLDEHYTSSSLDQLSVHPDLVRNIKYGAMSYDPTCFTSDMVNYVSRNESLVSADNVAVANLSHPISSNLNLPAAKPGDPHNCSNWKSLASHQNCDWIVNNYHRNNNPTSISESSSNPLFSGGEGRGSFKSSLVASPSSYNYQNTLQEVVTSAGVGPQGQDVVRYGGKDSNELVLLPSYNDYQVAQGRSCDGAVWVNRPMEVFRNQNGQDLANKSIRKHLTVGDVSNTQGLSLSLSSVSQTNNRREGQFGERSGLSDRPLDSKPFKSHYLGSSSRPSVGNKVYGITSIPHRDAAGPYGPFTGYATILKNSKYLNPTLQLMDELCRVTGLTQIEPREVYSGKNFDEAVVSAADHAVNVAHDSMVGTTGSYSGASSSSFYSSNGVGGEAGGRSNANESYLPENHQKKTKLLCMQEELCRRYRQYHQQMQNVVTSFESVAGLSAAAPYISVALRTVSRHFRCLKQVISEQLGHIGRTLGDDLSSPTAGTSSSTKCDLSTSGLRLIEHQKQKSCGSSMIIFEPQQAVWRPQRGLPERAVAVLRAWLFDHFLHPYPTDTDKHMLATQTGLTRNQVSNWFINARVRVWKPMVEEIHVLETKGSAESSSHTGKPDCNAASEYTTNQYDTQPINKPCGNDHSRSRDMTSAGVWNQEKRSRLECQIPAGMDAGSLMSFLPYQRGELEVGSGLGAVSLTLGLRQSAESGQHQQQQDQYQQHFGGHMIHDFVG
ncbi:BEL1-like homeodomain protein 8 [Heracleum sosnowskyi]|uniref:BEL1-like homeodomain protein 8 n=1 Tax=Heracleum sosnowskyi TaxID=360622 RepID=A0AAD8H0R3_9APIA|nr:BEL1-like homeodomain protein 8 [Heracleum sosnowskyi]